MVWQASQRYVRPNAPTISVRFHDEPNKSQERKLVGWLAAIGCYWFAGPKWGPSYQLINIAPATDDATSSL